MKQEDYLIAMASKLIAMASKLIAMASKVRGFNPSTTRSAPNATAPRAPDDSPWETITDGRRNVVHDWIDGRWNDVKAASHKSKPDARQIQYLSDFEEPILLHSLPIHEVLPQPHSWWSLPRPNMWMRCFSRSGRQWAKLCARSGWGETHLCRTVSGDERESPANQDASILICAADGKHARPVETRLGRSEKRW